MNSYAIIFKARILCNILKGLDFNDFFLESSFTLTKEDKDIRRKEYDVLCEHVSDVLCEHVSDVLCERVSDVLCEYAFDWLGFVPKY